jgi:hypothetical protein
LRCSAPPIILQTRRHLVAAELESFCAPGDAKIIYVKVLNTVA